MMHSDPVAYFLTFSTYGKWLHGRDTGSVDRHHNVYDTPVLAPDPELERRQRGRMTQPEYRLDENMRTVVLNTIVEVAAHRGWNLWATHVRTNHVHVVITAEAKPEKVLNDLKAWCSRRLRESLHESADRERWTRHGSTRYIWKLDALAEKIRYVLDDQGERMAWFRAESVKDETQSTLHTPALTLSALNSFEVIDDAMADILRRKSDAQRLQSVDAFWNSARAILKAGIRTEHPEWSLEQIHREVARRISNGALDHVHA